MPGAGTSLGFSSQDQETELGDLRVEGRLPGWLRGG
jgi:hypothetical protein